MAGDALRVAAAFVRDRWGWRPHDRASLEALQAARLHAFLRDVLPRAPFYRDRPAQLDALPIVDKATMLADFASFNTVGVTLDAALDVATKAERSRDFAPTLPGGISVGLSSGTSGTRGVFLVRPDERTRWAGVLLSRLLAERSLLRVLDLAGPPLRVAFFLRANSNLYTTVASRRIDFAFHDLLTPFEQHLVRLARHAPEILVAPPTVLRALAEAALVGGLRIAPAQVVSVAEVLEADDVTLIERAWGTPVQQVYQATEGFLGITCPEGRLHLNEDLVHVEPEWIDDGTPVPTRFHPIVTDFSRTTQLVVRYRLDDVLRVGEVRGPCGRPTRAIAAIEGRADDVLTLRALAGGVVRVFPDVLRRALALVHGLGDYRLEQHGGEWRVRARSADPDLAARLTHESETLASQLGGRAPVVRLMQWEDDAPGTKRRRIRCVEAIA
ncbi:MAG: F390 synthetase-related protein [Vicinamibacterales bacterium]